jgi:hypothetical protein
VGCVVAIVKGRIAHPATRNGLSRVQFRYPGTKLPAAVFALESNEIPSKSFRITARTVVRVSERFQYNFRASVRIIGRLDIETDCQSVLRQRLQKLLDTQAWVVKNVMKSFDTSIHCYGQFVKEFTTAMIIGQRASLNSKTSQTVYNVLVDEDHVIQIQE